MEGNGKSVIDAAEEMISHCIQNESANIQINCCLFKHFLSKINEKSLISASQMCIIAGFIGLLR